MPTTIEQQSTLYRATVSIPELGARAGDFVAIYANTVHIVRELPRAVLTPELAVNLKAVR